MILLWQCWYLLDYTDNDYCKTPRRSKIISSDKFDVYDKGCASSDSYKDRLNNVLQNELEEKKPTASHISVSSHCGNAPNTMDVKSISNVVLRLTSPCRDQSQTNPLDALIGVKDAKKKQSHDASIVYEKGSATSNSYKNRLNMVLQNEEGHLQPITRLTNIDFENRKGKDEQEGDFTQVEKITIEDNPYYGQI